MALRATVIRAEEVIVRKSKRTRNGRVVDMTWWNDVLESFELGDIVVGTWLEDQPSGYTEQSRYKVQRYTRGDRAGQVKYKEDGTIIRQDMLRTVRANIMAAFAKLDKERGTNFTNGGTFKDSLFHWGKEATDPESGEILLTIKLDERQPKKKKDAALPMIPAADAEAKKLAESERVAKAGARNGKQ